MTYQITYTESPAIQQIRGDSIEVVLQNVKKGWNVTKLTVEEDLPPFNKVDMTEQFKALINQVTHKE